jgi:hypothetical protein
MERAARPDCRAGAEQTFLANIVPQRAFFLIFYQYSVKNRALRMK